MFVQKGGDADWALCGMMFEDAMRPDHRHIWHRKVWEMRGACGNPWLTQPGQSIWKHSMATTRPRKPSSVSGSDVFSHSEARVGGTKSDLVCAFGKEPAAGAAAGWCYGLTLPGRLRSPEATSNTSVTHKSGAWMLAFTPSAAVTPS